MGERQQTREEDFGTVEFVEEARRPLVLQRHRPAVGAAEGGLRDDMLGSRLDPQLAQRLAAVTGVAPVAPPTAAITKPEVSASAATVLYAFEDHDSAPAPEAGAAADDAGEGTPLTGIDPRQLVLELSDDASLAGVTLQTALIGRLCMLKEDRQAVNADLRLVALGCYRLLAERLKAVQGARPTLDDLRAAPLTDVPLILEPRPWTFGDHRLHRPFTKGHAKLVLESIRKLVKAPAQASGWSDAMRKVEIARDDEDKVLKLPAAEQAAARDFLMRDRVRSRFYRQVFLDFFSVDQCDVDAECKGEPNLITWLTAISATPHLYPFLQGQEESQKRFRIARLAEKIVQLYEIYARIDQAMSRDRLRDKLAGKTSRERLSYLVQVHYPMIPSSTDLTLAALLCPLRVFIGFIQEKVQAGDFVLPPDPKPVAK